MNEITLRADIAGMVAAMTEGERVESEKSPKTRLVDLDSATRRARRLAVQFDVGELCFLRVAVVAEKPFQRL